MTTLGAVQHERDLTDDLHALARRIAELPVPRSALATDADVRNVVGSIAAILKAPRTSRDQATFQLGMYRKALTGHLSADALSYAGERALRELQWMPTPAELIALAKPFTNPEALIHAKARLLCRERAHRLMEETCLKLSRREYPEAEINDLPERWLKIAETQGHILLQLNGQYVYRSREAWITDVEARTAQWQGDTAKQAEGELSPTVERRNARAGGGFHDTRKAEGEIGDGQ